MFLVGSFLQYREYFNKLLRRMVLTNLLALTFSTNVGVPYIFDLKVNDAIVNTNSKDEWCNLIQDIIQVESGYKDSSITGDGGKAMGYLQIHKIMIDDVNRISGYKKYNYSDRKNLRKSIEIFNIYQNYYNPEKDLIIAARIWNAGPKGKLEKHYHLTDDYIRKLNLEE